jgi:hypothetical protein
MSTFHQCQCQWWLEAKLEVNEPGSERMPALGQRGKCNVAYILQRLPQGTPEANAFITETGSERASHNSHDENNF